MHFIDVYMKKLVRNVEIVYDIVERMTGIRCWDVRNVKMAIKNKKKKARSYFARLVASHLFVLLVTVCIMVGFNYRRSQNEQEQRVLDLVNYSARQTVMSIESRFSQMEQVCDMVCSMIQQMLRKTRDLLPQPQEEANMIGDIRTMRDAFGFLDITAWMPADFFSANEGLTFFNTQSKNARSDVLQVQQSRSGQRSFMFVHDYTYPFVRFQRNEAYNLFSCFIRVGTVSKPDAFCLFVDVDEREIAGLLAEQGSSQIEQYILDSQGMIVCHPDETKIGTYASDEIMAGISNCGDEHTGMHDFVGDSCLLHYPIGDTDWILVVRVPRSYMESISLTSAWGMAPAVFFAVIISVVLSVMISHQLTRKLVSMKAVIHSIHPNYNEMSEELTVIDARMPVPPPDTPPDVLDELSIVFNALADKLNATMQEAITASVAHEKVRYQLLRSKINPHFLYNMLDSIKSCNTLGRTEDANIMLNRLASFYRLILRKNEQDLITIGEELEIVRLYLEMEAISHEHAFSFTISKEPDIELFAIPRFVLQPLVENCVVHGLPGDAKHMNIDISLCYEDDAIRIEIRDNGLGMDEATMARLMSVVRGEEGAMPKPGTTTAFWGLNNISARLKPYVVKPEEPIYYESCISEGTRISICLLQILPDGQ